MGKKHIIIPVSGLKKKFNSENFNPNHNQDIMISLKNVLLRGKSINQSIKFYLYSPYSQTTVRLIG